MWHQGHLLEVKYYRTLKTEEVLTQGKVQDNQEQGWSNSTPSLEDKNWERPTSRDRVRWEHKTIWSQQEHIKFGNCVLHRVLPREKPDLLPSLDFSEVLQPAPTDAKHSDNQGERRGTGRVSGSVTLRPSRIPTLRGRMPKSVVNSTIHRRREIQVDIAHLLQIQSCSNDIARNTLPGDRSRVFPQSWVCRRGFFTPENHSAVSFVQWFPWRSWCRGVSSISVNNQKIREENTGCAQHRRLHGTSNGPLADGFRFLRCHITKGTGWPNALDSSFGSPTPSWKPAEDL